MRNLVLTLHKYLIVDIHSNLQHCHLVSAAAVTWCKQTVYVPHHHPPLYSLYSTLTFYSHLRCIQSIYSPPPTPPRSSMIFLHIFYINIQQSPEVCMQPEASLNGPEKLFLTCIRWSRLFLSETEFTPASRQ